MVLAQANGSRERNFARSDRYVDVASAGLREPSSVDFNEELDAIAASGHRLDGTPIPGRWHTYPEMGAGGSIACLSSMGW